MQGLVILSGERRTLLIELHVVLDAQETLILCFPVNKAMMTGATTILVAELFRSESTLRDTVSLAKTMEAKSLLSNQLVFLLGGHEEKDFTGPNVVRLTTATVTDFLEFWRF